jgi:hypothetical protein
MIQKRDRPLSNHHSTLTRSRLARINRSATLYGKPFSSCRVTALEARTLTMARPYEVNDLVDMAQDAGARVIEILPDVEQWHGGFDRDTQSFWIEVPTRADGKVRLSFTEGALNT